jgi:hypothetical protein
MNSSSMLQSRSSQDLTSSADSIESVKSIVLALQRQPRYPPARSPELVVVKPDEKSPQTRDNRSGLSLHNLLTTVYRSLLYAPNSVPF